MNRFIKALESKYQAKIDEAIATIDLYMTRGAGVGDHPDVLGVIDKYLSILDNNNSKLELIKKVFPNNETVEKSDTDKT
jgi:hypothetical protein